MKIRFTSFGDAGNIAEERIGFMVMESCDLKFFAVCHTRKTEGGFYNKPEHMFWFYPKMVSVGDEIVLYTKRGKDSVEEKDGHTIHFIYWGLDDSIIRDNDCIVLSEISDWSVISCR